METNRVNLMFLALNNELIGTTIKTIEGEFLVLDLVNYDTMTATFTLEVQNTETFKVETSEFSDRVKQEIVSKSKKRYPNTKRLKPMRVSKY